MTPPLTKRQGEMRNLIDMEGGRDSLGKKPHDDNLWQMIRYCENISAYRMMQQLQYFEFFF